MTWLNNLQWFSEEKQGHLQLEQYQFDTTPPHPPKVQPAGCSFEHVSEHSEVQTAANKPPAPEKSTEHAIK